MLTVSMTFLQLPGATTAATLLRIKETRRQLHGSDEDQNSSSASDGSSSSSSSSSEEFLDIIFNGHDAEVDIATRRVHKRHSAHLYLHQHPEENTNDLEWANPCGGVFYPSASPVTNKPPASHYLKQLRISVSDEYHFINNSMHAIEKKCPGTWKQFYSFIPQLPLPGNVTLKRWYRDIQTFTASFAYLGRLQYKWDVSKLMTTGKLTHELDELLTSARSILCEIERAINGTYSSPSNQEKLTAISRAEMNEKLTFWARMKELNEPAAWDLCYVKSKYYHYLLRMWRIIRQQSKRKGQRRQSASSSLEDFSATLEENLSSTNEVDVSASQRADSSGSESLENRSQGKRAKRRQRKQRKANRRSAERSHHRKSEEASRGM